MSWLVKALNFPLRVLIRSYQLVVSPFFTGSCRFEPGCSSYALEALERHGPFAGSWLILKRLSRCHPFGGHGYDPVPDVIGAPTSIHSHKCGGEGCSSHSHEKVLAVK